MVLDEWHSVIQKGIDKGGSQEEDFDLYFVPYTKTKSK
jgi:hypothetical protein